MPAKAVASSVVLVHWNAAEAEDLASPLRLRGWEVRIEHGEARLQLSELRTNPPPVAIAISLRRLPSHGREVAHALWYTKWGRTIPIVFFDGEDDKVGKLRAQFPAAMFVKHAQLASTLDRLRRRVNEGGGRAGK